MKKITKPIIELKKVKKSYFLGEQEYPILHGISLLIKKGEFVALMGPSGSGKSTLMNILGCLDVPTGGDYRFDGTNISAFDKDKLAEIRNSKIGFVFQSFNLLNRYSTLKNVALPSFYAGNEDLTRAEKMLNQVGLSERIHHKPSELSGGQRQRVAIARALMNEPDIILADEPTGNLDSKSATEVMQILSKLNKKNKKTIILVTHDDYTASFAQRKIFLKDGVIVDMLT
jgi:putative ABC transport system ATP-binding protein